MPPEGAQLAAVGGISEVLARMPSDLRTGGMC